MINIDTSATAPVLQAQLEAQGYTLTRRQKDSLDRLQVDLDAINRLRERGYLHSLTVKALDKRLTLYAAAVVMLAKKRGE